MNELYKLIGLTVTAKIVHENENNSEILAEIIDVNVNTYHFYQKREPIHITVNIEPVGDLPNGVDFDDCNDIPIENIRYVSRN